MQARNDRESRFVHDQLATMAPLMLALSASTPIFKGQLAGTDTRWDVISQSVDDRTVFERGEPCNGVCVDPELVGGGVRRLAKSRYSSVSQYIGKTSSSAELTALKVSDTNWTFIASMRLLFSLCSLYFCEILSTSSRHQH